LYVKILHWRKTKLEWSERLSARKIKDEKAEGKEVGDLEEQTKK
jgi:hypothetical protein